MKKWGILALVVLGGLLLAMQYVLERGKAPRFQPRAGADLPAGVSLPPGATSYSAPVSVPEGANAGTADFIGLLTPKAATTYKGACAGASLEEILASHGKVWGYSVRLGSSFNFKENQDIYDLLGKYYGCVALARSRIGICDLLPGEINHDGLFVSLERSPAVKCRIMSDKFFSVGYTTGRFTDTAYCLKKMDDWAAANEIRMSAGEFCEAAARGNGPAGALMGKYMPESKALVGKYLPVSVSDCVGDRECLANYSRYTAIKKGVPGDCPPEDRPYCAALVTRSDSSCDKLLAQLSQAYCTHVKRVKKGTRGYLGMTDAEMKADIARLELQQDETARQKKEAEKIQQDINVRARKILRKKR